MFRKGIALVVLLIFVWVSLFPSYSSIVNKKNNQINEIFEVHEKNLSLSTIWYTYIQYGSNGSGFYTFGPDNTTYFHEWDSGILFSGSTWTNDGRLFFCAYYNGTLYEVDSITFDVWSIGDGGSGLNGLAYNPVNEDLYGISNYGLYEIDMVTGNQTYIGGFGSGPNLMFAIAFDSEGVLYGFDLGDKLWTINTDTGKAAMVGSLGININYGPDCSFDYVEDELYLAACTLSPGYGCFWYVCDEDSGDCNEIIGLEEIPNAFAISYEINMKSPNTSISFNPLEPNGDNGWYVSNIVVTLNATDESGVKFYILQYQ